MKTVHHVTCTRTKTVCRSYNQTASDITASTASTTILQCPQQGSRGAVTALLLTSGLYEVNGDGNHNYDLSNNRH